MSSGVKRLKTDESARRKFPASVVLCMISAKKRGLTEFCESQQGMRKATGSVFGMVKSRSMFRFTVLFALAKSPPASRGQG